MPSEPEQLSEKPAESNEKKLCLSCMFPNDPDVHFCAECGAPMTSYAATGPFEHIFAEGYVYRQAAERPRKFIVVLGVWLIFGTLALGGAVLLFMGLDMSFVEMLVGAFFLLISAVMIAKTTRSYFTRPRPNKNGDA